MKLRQGQVWRLNDQYVRIVVLERLAVDNKTMPDLESKAGTHHRVTKKQFCALLKTAALVPPAQP